MQEQAVTGPVQEASDEDIGVLVVDDNEVVRMGLSMLLDALPGIAVVGEAASGQGCVDAVEAMAPDVVLLDVRMPGSFDGVVAAGMIADRVKVLMMTYAEDQLVVRKALEAGARGYLIHGDATPDDIETAIRTVHAGKVYLTGRAGEVLVGMLPSVASESALRDAVPSPDGWGLTRREIEIMTLLAEGKSNSDIAGELVISPHTLKNHITRIFDKMGARTRAEAIVAWLAARDQLTATRDQP